jgi:5'-nucleotidase
MIILLTNDDGIYAEGIQTMGEKLLSDENIELYVVAPDHEQSATGHSITMHRPLRTEAVKFYHNPNLKGWSVNGTPADCVKLAVEYLLPKKPDLVISGINNGSNLGNDILYSGTVSAAIEAIILGVPALAVSLTEHMNSDFHFAADFTFKLVRVIEDNNLPKNTLLNINIPGTKRDEIAGIAVTRLGTRQYRNAFQERIDPRGKNYFWLAGEVVDTFHDDEDTDVAAIHNSFISITPLHFDLTNFKLLDTLKSIEWDF